jgi:hypothetical protein
MIMKTCFLVCYVMYFGSLIILLIFLNEYFTTLSVFKLDR